MNSTNQSAVGTVKSDIFQVVFFLVPGFSLMALSSAIEPLRSVNRITGEHRYSWHFVAPKAGMVRAGNGLEVAASFGIDNAPTANLTVVVASLDIETFCKPTVMDWIRSRRGNHSLLAAVSLGPLILARAGILKGKRTTVHWEMQRSMAEEFPEIEVVDALYCVDGDVMTAAGGTAGMDMMLALIAARDGGDVAADVSEQFLHGPLRSSGEMQRQGIEWRYQVSDGRLITAIRLMEQQMSRPTRISRLAEIAAVSERQLERLFEGELGKRPSEFYLDMRLKASRQMVLYSPHSLEIIPRQPDFQALGISAVRSNASSVSRHQRQGDVQERAMSAGCKELATGRNVVRRTLRYLQEDAASAILCRSRQVWISHGHDQVRPRQL
jgi:transcriptional regulator GlxA family with amidase domain